ncbi:hypothetical protein [Ancylobacter terrae]|uniref:hypothetical protein n=1 Tax=Ancylobacter sp. sgz301288 TaxID=3342077 RepID=UPI00385A8F81
METDGRTARRAALLSVPLMLALGAGLARSVVGAEAAAPATDAAAIAAPAPAPALGAAAAPQLDLPPAPVLLALVRNALAAVNQANITGNYSVLRDLGAPAFRERQTVATLADHFRGLRERQLDFAATLLLDAKLTRAPEITPEGMLRIAGFFPTQPLKVEFDLGFAPIAGNWRLASVTIDAREGEGAAPLAAKPVTTSTIAARAGDADAGPAAPAKAASAMPDQSRPAKSEERVAQSAVPRLPALVTADTPAGWKPAALAAPPTSAQLPMLAAERARILPTPPGDRPRG